MRLVTFGIGYVGLVTGTGSPNSGTMSYASTSIPERIRQLEDGIIPIYEPGLADLVSRNERAGRLRFSTDVAPAFDEADAYFVAVGTPPGPDGAADVSAVLAVAERIAATAKQARAHRRQEHGPRRHVRRRAGRADAHRKPSVPLEVVSNPEFLKEGAAVQDFFRPDRVVLGARSEARARCSAPSMRRCSCRVSASS